MFAAVDPIRGLMAVSAQREKKKKRATEGPVEKFMVFRIAGERYAIELLRVKEVIGRRPITRVPGSAPALAGLVNLRGSMWPVLDLAKKLGVEQTPRAHACLIFVSDPRAGRPPCVSFLVDELPEVSAVETRSLEASPDRSPLVRASFVRGEEVVLVLDVDQLLAGVETAELSSPARV